MQLHGVPIVDTFAEAFPMKATRVIITAADTAWARRAGEAMTGFATSVIACGAEAGIERDVPADQTPDGRPGVAVLLFALSSKELEKQLLRRVGQCVLTCPTTAAFAGIDGGTSMPLGKSLRYFGDGYQISKIVDGRRYWRVPVMDGEFLCEETTDRVSAIGGGNFIVIASTLDGAVRCCEAAVEAMDEIPETITPFPGGVARSGSKVGSKYKSLTASTNEAFCPTLRGLVDSLLPESAAASLEVVIDGLTEQAIADATRVGIQAACRAGRTNGLLQITAGNYGGKLGKYHFHLREILGG